MISTFFFFLKNFLYSKPVAGASPTSSFLISLNRGCLASRANMKSALWDVVRKAPLCSKRLKANSRSTFFCDETPSTKTCTSLLAARKKKSKMQLPFRHLHALLTLNKV